MYLRDRDSVLRFSETNFQTSDARSLARKRTPKEVRHEGGDFVALIL
jgi:hypothetical protein